MCHHSKHLMGYFEFLNGSRIICLPLNILEKLRWRKARTGFIFISIAFIFFNTIQYPRTLKNNIYQKTNEREPPPFFHSVTDTWPRSGAFCWQNPCSGCNSWTDLVNVFEYIFFQLLFQHRTNLLGSQDTEEAM